MSVSFANDDEVQKNLEFFIFMFHLISSRIAEKNFHLVSVFIFVLAFWVRTPSFSDEIGYRDHSSSGGLASGHNKNPGIDYSTNSKQMNKYSWIESAMTTMSLQIKKLTITRNISAKRQYIVTDMRRRLMLGKTFIRFNCKISKLMKFNNMLSVPLLFAFQKWWIIRFKICKIKFVRIVLKNISERRRSDTYIFEFKRINVDLVKIFSELTFSLTNGMILHCFFKISIVYNTIL